MVAALEEQIDALSAEVEMPTEFVVPGENVVRSPRRGAHRGAARRADRCGLQLGGLVRSCAYLNRLSDLVWTMARWAEGDEHLPAKQKRS